MTVSQDQGESPMWCFGQKPNTDKGLSLSLLIVVWRHSVSLPGPNRTRNASQWAVGEFQRPPSDRSQQLPINDIPGAAATRSSTGMSNLRTRAPAQMIVTPTKSSRNIRGLVGQGGCTPRSTRGSGLATERSKPRRMTQSVAPYICRMAAATSSGASSWK